MKISRRQLRKLILNEMKPYYGKAQEPRFFSPGSILAPGGFSAGPKPLVPKSMDFLRGKNISLDLGGQGFGITDLDTKKVIMNDKEPPEQVVGQVFYDFLEELGLTNEDGTINGKGLIDLLHLAASTKGGTFEVDSEVLEELGITDDDGDDI